MKTTWSVVFVFVLAFTTACGTNAPVATATLAPTGTPIPPTATLVPSATATPTQGPTPTSTPIPRVNLSLGFNSCSTQQTLEGQVILLQGKNMGLLYPTEGLADYFAVTAYANVKIDKDIRITVKGAKNWTKKKESNGYAIYFKWQLPQLDPGIHHIEVAFSTGGYTFLRGCTDLNVKSVSGNLPVSSELYLSKDASCNQYQITEGQKVTITGHGLGLTNQTPEENMIKYSVMSITVDGSSPIETSGKEGWSEVKFDQTLRVYNADWSWIPPTLSKGQHKITVRYDVSEPVNIGPITIDSSRPVWVGCVDITVK